jgi:seryl-tRNA synthetase
MKSKRDLKKQVRYVCCDIVSELLLVGELVPEEKQDEVAQLVVETAVLQEQTIKHATFGFDKSIRDFANGAEYRKARRSYYRQAYAALHKEFNESLAKIVDSLNDLAGLGKKK